MSNPFAALAIKDPDDDQDQINQPPIPPPPHPSHPQPTRTAPAFRSLESSRAITRPNAIRQGISFSDAVSAQTNAIAADILPSAASIPIDASLAVTIKISPLNPTDTPVIEHSDITLLAVATAFASQKAFAKLRPSMHPSNGLSFHFQKIRDYPESGFFFHCVFKSHSASLSSLRDVEWQPLLSACRSFTFSCPARDKKTRISKQIQARVDVISSPLFTDQEQSRTLQRNPIQCFILFNPILLQDPLNQICEVLTLAKLANISFIDHISIPPPLAGKHASAHTKQIVLTIPFPSGTDDSEQLLYNLTLAHHKGISALFNEDSTPPALAASISLRLPMVTDPLGRRALSIPLQEYFVFLLDSPEFNQIARKKSRVDRRGIFHEGSSATESDAEALPKAANPGSPDADFAPSPVTFTTAASQNPADAFAPQTKAAANIVAVATRVNSAGPTFSAAPAALDIDAASAPTAAAAAIAAAVNPTATAAFAITSPPRSNPTSTAAAVAAAAPPPAAKPNFDDSDAAFNFDVEDPSNPSADTEAANSATAAEAARQVEIARQQADIARQTAIAKLEAAAKTAAEVEAALQTAATSSRTPNTARGASARIAEAAAKPSAGAPMKP
jgi:hypothetical protein